MKRSTTYADPLVGYELVTWRRLEQIVPYSIQYVWRMEQAGTFPKRISLGPKRCAWRVADIQNWLAERGITA